MPQSQGLAYLLDKPGTTTGNCFCVSSSHTLPRTLSPVSGLCVKVKTSEVGGGLLQVTLLIIPVRHLAPNPGTGQEEI